MREFEPGPYVVRFPFARGTPPLSMYERATCNEIRHAMLPCRRLVDILREDMLTSGSRVLSGREPTTSTRRCYRLVARVALSRKTSPGQLSKPTNSANTTRWAFRPKSFTWSFDLAAPSCVSRLA